MRLTSFPISGVVILQDDVSFHISLFLQNNPSPKLFHLQIFNFPTWNSFYHCAPHCTTETFLQSNLLNFVIFFSFLNYIYVKTQKLHLSFLNPDYFRKGRWFPFSTLVGKQQPEVVDKPQLEEKLIAKTALWIDYAMTLCIVHIFQKVILEM